LPQPTKQTAFRVPLTRRGIVSLAQRKLARIGRPSDLRSRSACCWPVSSCAGRLDWGLECGEWALTAACGRCAGLIRPGPGARRSGRPALVVPGCQWRPQAAAWFEGSDGLAAAALDQWRRLLADPRQAKLFGPRRQPIKALTAPELADVRGQEHGAGALEIAAAGNPPPACWLARPEKRQDDAGRRLCWLLPTPSAREARGAAQVFLFGVGGCCGPHTALLAAKRRSARPPQLHGSSPDRRRRLFPARELHWRTTALLFLDELTEFRRGGA